MITFKSTTMKNLLSVGDNPLSIQLDRSPSTIVTGPNGVGKTTVIIESIYFGCFGKSYRGIKKESLINTVNQKACLVTIKFNRGPDEYVVTRGMKPTVFTIEKNGQMLDNLAAVRDMQEYLETQILGFDGPSFIRTCLLSVMNYTPFMQLTSSDRRKLVETLLDAQVITDMNSINKGQISLVKQQLQQKKADFQTASTTYNTLKTAFDSVNASTQDLIEPLKQEAHTLADMYRNHASDLSKLQEMIAALEQENQGNTAELLNSLKTTLNDFDNAVREKQFSINVLEKANQYVSSNSTCNTCKQPITSEYSQKLIEDNSNQITDLNRNKDEVINASTTVRDQIKKIEDYLVTWNRMKTGESALQSRMDALKKTMTDKIAEINRLSTKEATTNQVNEEQLNEQRILIKTLASEIDELSDEQEILTMAADLLKDTGIKSSIVDIYLPLLVGYTNKYLQAMNFPIKFEMNNEFDVTLRSRYANEFTYANLSAGERQRVDLALAFAWRQVSRMKNSVNTNLLVLDEILDASLDSNGSEDALALLDEVCEGQNVFIISHKGHLCDVVRSRIDLVKVNGFTRIS